MVRGEGDGNNIKKFQEDHRKAWDDCYIIPTKIIKGFDIDLRNTTKLTWKNVVLSSLEKLGGKAELKKLYQQIKGHKKTKSNRYWKAKIRQVLRRYSEEFMLVESGAIVHGK